MENALKRDVLRELHSGQGRLLLHDEIEERLGTFDIVPIWENIQDADVLTPRDAFDLMISEGFQVTYTRTHMDIARSNLSMNVARL